MIEMQRRMQYSGVVTNPVYTTPWSRLTYLQTILDYTPNSARHGFGFKVYCGFSTQVMGSVIAKAIVVDSDFVAQPILIS